MAEFHIKHEKILNFIDTVVEDELKNNTKEPVCENGCFYCCTFPIPVGVLELLYIAKKVNEFSDEKKEIILKNIDTAYQYSYHQDKYIKKAYFNNTLENFRTICPFIHNGSCMIYQFRPTNCRTNFSTDVKLCKKGKSDINFLKTPKVNTVINLNAFSKEKEQYKKGFLHNAFIFDGERIQVDPIYIFEDDINMENAIKLSQLLLNTK